MSKGFPSPDKYEVPNEVKNEVRLLIKKFMADEKITAEGLAKKLNEVYGRSASRSNISNKLTRASFSLAEFLQITKAYGYEITLTKTDRTTQNKADA